MERPLRLGTVLCALTLAAIGCQEPRHARTVSHGDDVTTVTTTVTPGGHRISGPHTHANLDVYFVHGSDRHDHGEVLTLREALQQGKVKVHETGEVRELAIENLSPTHSIYVQAGEIVQGGKQDRVIAAELMVRPKSGRVPLGSFCVEQGRWGARGLGGQRLAAAQGQARIVEAAFDSNQTRGGQLAGYTQRAAVAFASSANAVTSSGLKSALLTKKAQGEVWNEVQRLQGKLAANLKTDVQSPASRSSLELTLESKPLQEAGQAYEKALRTNIDAHADVTGFVFAIGGRLHTAELYASRRLAARMWPKMLRAAAVEAMARGDQKRVAVPVTHASIDAFVSLPDTAGRLDEKTRMRVVDRGDTVFYESRHEDTGWTHRSFFRK